VSLVFLQRVAGLAAAALLAGVSSLALAQAGRDDKQLIVPEPAVGAWGGWTAARAGVATGLSGRGGAEDCGWLVGPMSMGVIHPVLPCGARIFIEHGGRRALTRVVAQSPVGNGRQFDLTPRLAKALGVTGVRDVRWAFSR